MVCFLRRTPGSTLRKAENLGYGRFMTFSRETVDNLLGLLRQTMDGMRGSKRVHTETHAGKGRTVKVAVVEKQTCQQRFPL
jgi:hypothetical protein